MMKNKHSSNSPTKSRKKQNQKKTHSKTVKVQGYWQLRRGAPVKVKPYSYKRKSYGNSKPRKPKKKLPIRMYPGRKIPPAPPGYKFVKRYEFSEADERVVYTYKIEALIEYSGRYVMTFSMDKDLKGQMAIEYYHTHFEPTIEKATVDFQELLPQLNAYGHVVTYLSIDLYRVTGEGNLRDKNWKLIKSYDSPEEVK